MAEILNEEEESKLKIRLRSQRHIRTLLIIINLLLAGYLVYFIGDSISDKVNGTDENIVTLNDLTINESKKKYEEIFDLIVESDEGDTIEDKYEKGSITFGDYIVYGQYLHFSKDQFLLPEYQALENISSVLVEEEPLAFTLQTIGTSLNEGIDLSLLDEGDYMFSYGIGNDAKFIKVVLGKENYQETIYTLPNIDGVRKAVTLYAYPNNPAFVVKVRDIKELPNDAYDVVIATSKMVKEIVNPLFEENGALANLNLKIKWIDSDEQKNLLNEVYKIKSTVAINLCNVDIKDGIICSNFIKADEFIKDDLLVDCFLEGLDGTAFIRELGGYAYCSGSRFENVLGSFDVASSKGIHDASKMAFEIYASTEENFISYLTQLITFVL